MEFEISNAAREVRNVKCSLDYEIRSLRSAHEKAYRVLYPVLCVLEEEDIPVDYVNWGQYAKSVLLIEEAKLTSGAYYGILEILSLGYNCDTEVEKVVHDTYVRFIFRVEGIIVLILSNGNRTCKTIKVNERTQAYTTCDYEVANGCSGLELR